MKDNSELVRNRRSGVRALALLIQLLIAAWGTWVIIYLIAIQAAGRHDGPIASTHNLAPWFGPIAGLLVLVALLFRYRWLLIGVLLPGLVAFLVWYGPLFLSQSTATTGEQSLTAVAFNILSPRSEPDKIVEALRELESADVVGLNELGPDHAAQIDAAFATAFPYSELHPRTPENMGVGLLSKYPIVSMELFQPVADSMLHMRAVVDYDGTRIVVYVVHPRPPENRRNPLRYDAAQRDEELRHVRQRLGQETQPILLLCDCNMPDRSKAHGQMDDILDDAFRHAGHGLGFTFPAYRRFIPSAIRIDYIWISSHFEAIDADTAANPGTSDHRPVIAELVLRE